MPLKRIFGRVPIEPDDTPMGGVANPIEVNVVAGSVVSSPSLEAPAGVLSFHQHFYSSLVSTTLGTAWGLGGVYAGFLAAAATVTVESAAAGDTNRVVRVYGLDANWLEIYEDITTDGADGTTPVAGVLEFKRVYKHEVINGGQTAGAIAVRSTGAGTPYMSHGREKLGASTDGFYTIPDGYTGYLRRWAAWNGSDTAIEVMLQTRKSTENTFHMLAYGWAQPLGPAIGSEFGAGNTVDLGIALVARSDVLVQAVHAGTGNKQLHGSFEIVLVPN